MPDKEDGASATASSTQEDAAARRKRFTEAIDKIRQRADTTAKALAALATTVLSAVGIAKFADIFPLPPNTLAAAVLLVAGFLFMAAAAGYLVKRLWKVGELIVTKSDPEAMGLDDGELDLVKDIYEETADENQTKSLKAYEARAMRFDRIAERLDPKDAEVLRARAHLIRSVISETMVRGAAIVVRDRANRAILDTKVAYAAVIFVLGLGFFAGSADYLDAQRSSKIAIAKNCAEARTANAEDLPPICGDEPTEEASEDEPSSADHFAAALEALAKEYKECQLSLDADGGSETDCQLILSAIDEMT